MTAEKMNIAKCKKKTVKSNIFKAVSVLVSAILFAKVLLLVLTIVFARINIPGRDYCDPRQTKHSNELISNVLH